MDKRLESGGRSSKHDNRATIPACGMLKTEALFSPDDRSLGWRAYVLIALLCLAFFLPGLTSIPPVDRDEARFAQATKQMIETGDYIDIRFQKEARHKKPAGIYWLQAASVRLLNPHGLNEIWAYRIPSLIGATLAVLFTGALGTLFFGGAAGSMAALLMASCLLLNVEARLAKTDAFLLACVMASQYAMARAYRLSPPLPLPPAFAGAGSGSKSQSDFGEGSKATLPHAIFLIFWIAQGVGFLIKGPIVLFVTLSTLLYLRITEKRLDWFRALRPFLGLPLALLIAAPWFVAITLASNGGFAAQSAGHDLFAKLWQGQNRGIIPPGVHLLVFPMVFFPGSLLALLAIPGVWTNRREPAVRFLLGWIVPPWIVFELSFTKLPHYVLPVYPAIAILAAAMMRQGFPGIMDKGWRWLSALAFGAWLLCGMALALGVTAGPALLERSWLAAGFTAALALLSAQAAFFALLSSRPENGPGNVAVLAGGMLLFTVFAFGNIAPSLKSAWLSLQAVRIAESVKPCRDMKIVSAVYNEPSLIFLAGTETTAFNKGTEIAEKMRQDPCAIGLVQAPQDASFLAAFEDAAAKPLALGRVEGFNLGNGRKTALTIYRLAGNGEKP